ncbi:MAG TPA: S-layer homology domain-containing protein [Clostridiaceae bacterium]|nr:S-layer homology domain-containing protein [Clostridiaceae bacterium]
MKKLAILFLITALVFGSVNLMPYKVEAEEAVEEAEGIEALSDYIPPASLITDISNHWAKEYISELINYGILSGYSDKTFKPDNQITRSEYLAALFKTVCILDESIDSEEYSAYMGNLYFYGYRAAERIEFLENFKKANYDAPYKDLENYWAKNIVAWTKNYADKKNPGLFEKVFPGENFYPDQPITREEAAAITVVFVAPPVRSKNIQFKDIASDYKYIDEITYLVDNEIIKGLPDGTFRPKENITRAAAAVIMTNVLKDIAYNTDFFASPDNYMTFIGSSSDGDYIPTFMSEELYENPLTEEDKKYVAYFKGYTMDRQMIQELMGGFYEQDLEDKGLEYGTEEYEKAVKQLEDEIIAKYEKMKREEIPYYHGDEDRLNVLKELEQQDYWNRAGLYYWLYRYDENKPIEYLEKAEEAYDINRNGKEDLYYLYKAFVDYYTSKEKDNEKVVEYIHKMENLFVPDEYGIERVAVVDIERFYLFAAYDLALVEEYSEALNYVDKFLAKMQPYENIILEKGSLMYLAGQKDAAIEYLKENLVALEHQEYVDEYLKTKFIWTIKTMMRQK